MRTYLNTILFIVLWYYNIMGMLVCVLLTMLSCEEGAFIWPQANRLQRQATINASNDLVAMCRSHAVDRPSVLPSVCPVCRKANALQ